MLGVYKVGFRPHRIGLQTVEDVAIAEGYDDRPEKPTPRAQ